MLLGPRIQKSLNNIEIIQPRMMAGMFNSNPNTTIISCYNPTNASNETDLYTFNNKLSSLICSIPKHKALIVSEDMNAQIGKNVNNKYSLHNLSNRNGEYLTYFTVENGLTCLNTKFQKMKGKLWTFTFANNAKAQIGYILLNKKWINNALNRDTLLFWRCLYWPTNFHSKDSSEPTQE